MCFVEVEQHNILRRCHTTLWSVIILWKAGRMFVGKKHACLRASFWRQSWTFQRRSRELSVTEQETGKSSLKIRAMPLPAALSFALKSIMRLASVFTVVNYCCSLVTFLNNWSSDRSHPTWRVDDDGVACWHGFFSSETVKINVKY